MPISTWGNDPGLITLAGLAAGGVGSFNHFAIPEFVKSGGPYRHHVHKQPGGARQIDMMGDDPDDFEWNGVFLEAEAAAQYEYFDNLRKAGNPIVLAYRVKTVLVVISELSWNYMSPRRVEYHIKCTPVVSGDNAAQQQQAPNLNNAANIPAGP